MASQPRTDEDGAAFKGSQKHIQRYVNSKTLELNCALATALGADFGGEVEWVSPLENQGFAEFRDGAFLAALGLDALADELKDFWPSRGPRWDALGRGKSGQIFLVEAKSYPEEMRGTGSKSEPASRARIENRLDETAQKLGLVGAPEIWKGDLYQYANRLAHLQFLRDNNIEAFLLNVCFVNDSHRSTTLQEWHEELARIKSELEVPGELPYVRNVFLPAEKL